MLTEQDIQDLKDYTSDYDDFCRNHLCDYRCEIFQKSKETGKSCFKVYCDMRRSQKKE